VFRPHASQQEIFDVAGEPTVNAVMDGFNSAVIAYGQTGSGKTYSMVGPGYDGIAEMDEGKAMRDPGLIPRIVSALFQRIGTRRPLRTMSSTLCARPSWNFTRKSYGTCWRHASPRGTGTRGDSPRW